MTRVLFYRSWRHSSRIFLILLLAATLFPLRNVRCQQEEITILHTNDMHGQLMPVTAVWIDRDPKPKIGGMAALSGALNREAGPNSILLDAGDFQTGSPISNMMVHGARGGGYVQLMNLLGYDAVAIGNHEFDNGSENLKALMSAADFPLVSANLFKDGKLLADSACTLHSFGNLRVGVIGLTTFHLDDLLAAHQLEGIRITPLPETAQAWIDRLDPVTDLIILLTHQGVEEDSVLAASVHGADLIVGGHSHTRLYQPKRVNRMLIVQAGSSARYLGRLDLSVEADTIRAFKYRLIPLWADSLQPSSPIAELVSIFEKRIQDEYGKVIGELKTEWVRSRSRESNIGNFITDVMRAATGSDFAVMNSGGIRKNMAAGPIRKLDILEILPFTNYLARFQCTGRDLLTLIKTNAEAALTGAHGILQVSGLTYEYGRTADGGVLVRNPRVGSVPVQPDKMYTGVAVDFITGGNGPLYFGFEPSCVENTGILLTDAVIQFIETHPRILSDIEGRISE
jgi:2',3'-cyclic-nucleotide 2'-phosphodiesterase (5'-nucleotidase family)